MNKAMQVMYDKMAAMDNQDVPLEEYPEKILKELAHAGFVIVPIYIPYEILGDAALSGVCDLGNPNLVWDYLLTRVQVLPHKSN